ncbi:Cytoplasmic tRNA 2-thiolation protein 2 [Rhinocladiella similis]
MASYGFKNLSGEQKSRLFLPLSGGISSLVLLQVLDAQLQKQITNRNKTTYDVVVARVVLPAEQDSRSIKSDYEVLAGRFATHTFLPLLDLHEVLQLDRRVERDLKQLGIVRHDSESDQDFFLRIMRCSTSASAASDMQSVLLKRLLVAAARDQGCANVLWGHSDTRLAALTLADVAKGRGGSVSASIADGQTLQGIDFSYPVRDLFKAELQTYARASSEPILETTVEQDIPVQQPTSIRSTAIDNLLNTYITSQGEKYPSIVANVVRTASKLEARRPAENIRACPVCLMPVVGTQGLLNTDSGLCYGCERMRQDIVP